MALKLYAIFHINKVKYFGKDNEMQLVPAIFPRLRPARQLWLREVNLLRGQGRRMVSSDSVLIR